MGRLVGAKSHKKREEGDVIVDNTRERVVPLASIPADASAHICNIRLTVDSLNGTQHEAAYRITRIKLMAILMTAHCHC